MTNLSDDAFHDSGLPRYDFCQSCIIRLIARENRRIHLAGSTVKLILYAIITCIVLSRPALADPDVAPTIALQSQAACEGTIYNDRGCDARGNVGADDSTALQREADAATGGTFALRPDGKYRLGRPLYLKSGDLDCRGAQLSPKPGRGPYAIVWVQASRIAIRNCSFHSENSGLHFAIFLDAGVSDITIEGNRFTTSTHHQMAAVGIRKKGVRNVTVSNNRSDDLSFLVYVDGDETQTWRHCIILGSDDVCRNAPNPPPHGTTRIDLPASVVSDIDTKGNRYGVLVKNYRRAQDGYRLWEGADFERQGNSLVFRRPLDSGPEIEIQLFTWDPKVAPADDLKGLVVENNVGHRFRRAAVQINCPVLAYHRRTPGRDCPQEVRIVGNRFDMPFLLDTEHTVSRGDGPANLIRWSSNPARPPWSATGLRLSASAAVAAPDGTAGTVVLAPDLALAEHRLQQTVPVKSGGRYVWSLFAQPRAGTRGTLYLTDQAGNSIRVPFDAGKTAIAEPMRSGNVAEPRAGVVHQEDGWRRLWVSGTFGNDAAALTAGISLANDKNGGELLVWGPQLEAGSAPFVHMPTAAAPRSGITSQVISINGVTGFTIERNVISSAASQGIHTEDNASRGSITGNTITDAGGWGIYLTDSQSIAVTDNVITNSYLGCIALDATADAPRTYSKRYMTNSDITLAGNRCDLKDNQRSWAGFLISGAHEPLALTARGNVVANLSNQRAKGAYVFQGTARCDHNIGTASRISNSVPVYADCPEGGR